MKRSLHPFRPSFIYDTEGRELMGLGVNGKMEGVGEGTRGYVNIDVGERKR